MVCYYLNVTHTSQIDEGVGIALLNAQLLGGWKQYKNLIGRGSNKQGGPNKCFEI